jgi:hypothetical protein
MKYLDLLGKVEASMLGRFQYFSLVDVLYLKLQVILELFCADKVCVGDPLDYCLLHLY